MPWGGWTVMESGTWYRPPFVPLKGYLTNNVFGPNCFVPFHLQIQWSVSSSPGCDNAVILGVSVSRTSGMWHWSDTFRHPHRKFKSWSLGQVTSWAVFSSPPAFNTIYMVMITHFISNLTSPIIINWPIKLIASKIEMLIFISTPPPPHTPP